MSGSVSPTQLPSSGFTQSQASVLGPGIAGLFIQGIESGLVIAQFSQWFYRSDRSESSLLSTIVVLVTVVGLVQSGVCFISAWSKYVQQFGKFLLPNWEDYVQPIPTLIISVPIQASMIRRCYYLVGKNLFIITPLVLLLVASIVMSLWAKGVSSPQETGIYWPFLISVLLPSFLDLTLSAILLHYLTRAMKQVYAAHTRRRISRLVNIIWQSALPPTLCAVCMSVFYIRYTTVPQGDLPFWFPVIQAMIGKLYVLSFLYMVNSQPLQSDKRPTTFISTLTVPTEIMYPRTRDARADTVCSEIIVAERGRVRTVDFAV